MAYSESMLDQLMTWKKEGILPEFRAGDAVVELGSQMLNGGSRNSKVAEFIQQFNPKAKDVLATLDKKFPVNPHYHSHLADIWPMCGVDYFSYDVDEAPSCHLMDLNFASVPDHHRGKARLLTNFGTTEHIANQFNAFKAAHDLMGVGSVAIHHVPFSGMLNHCLINYHPKFFFSLIVNNRYKLRYFEYSPPGKHADLGEGNDVFEGDYIKALDNAPNSGTWANSPLPSGMLLLVIERRYDDEFVPPVDFTTGYFADFPKVDLGALVGLDDLPHSNWADAYRRNMTPSQNSLALRTSQHLQRNVSRFKSLGRRILKKVA
jgi:hypothetical protein